MSRHIEGDFKFAEGINHPPLVNAVVLDTTNGISVGYVMVEVELGWLGDPIAYLSPNRARELAFSLLDLADIAAIEAGDYEPDHDPFEDLLAEQAALQIADQL